jgi:hypothetical protein
MLYTQDGDYVGALPLYARLCATWPNDAVGFANACDCLMNLSRWADAEKILEAAPTCYEQFRLYHQQKENCRQRTLDLPSYGAAVFKGQPDLGGLLMPRRRRSDPCGAPISRARSVS